MGTNPNGPPGLHEEYLPFFPMDRAPAAQRGGTVLAGWTVGEAGKGGFPVSTAITSAGVIRADAGPRGAGADMRWAGRVRGLVG